MGIKFIEKKNALRFTLMHRSQHDGLEEGSSKYVLVPMNKYTARRQASVIDQSILYTEDKTRKDGYAEAYEKAKQQDDTEQPFRKASANPNEIVWDDNETCSSDSLETNTYTREKKRCEEEKQAKRNEAPLETLSPTLPCVGEAAKYGIFFDDRKYDYTQHLRPMGCSDAVYIPAKKLEPNLSAQPWEELNYYIKESSLAVDGISKGEWENPSVQEVLRTLQNDENDAFDKEEEYEWPDNLVELLDQSEEETGDKETNSKTLDSEE